MNKTCTDDANQKLDLDVITPVIFDNAYYIGLTMGQGVFTSDISLFRNPITKPIVCQFATDKDAFFKQFADSMFKLSNVPRNDGNRGEIRSNCFVSNAGPRRAVDAVIEQVVDFAASF
uniref:Plant heme peroxidase family profile domain-containing protein n=1 Tax=Leersia perrieri TaxID=77586 RepID=A0A0D9WBH2_9ORYZ